MRSPTSSPLVERDTDGSLVPSGRQMAPRQDDRTSYGLTDAEVVAFQYAVDEINGHPARIDQYVTIAESEAMLAVGIGSAAMDQKAAWLTVYRATHPLPTVYSYLPADDPSHYNPPAPVSIPVSVIAETMHALDQDAKPAAPIPAPAPVVVPVAPPVTSVVPQPSTAAIVAALAPSVVAAASGTTTSEKVAAAAVVAVTVMDALEPHVNDTGKSIIDVLRAVFSLFHH